MTGPVGNDNDGGAERPLAPWPTIDRWPVIIGSSLTIKYIASVMRLAQQGYRQQYCDVLAELLDRDPATFSVLAGRVLAAATGRIELTAAPTAEKDSPEAKRATEIRDLVQARLDAIPRFAFARAELLWGVYPGLSAQEILWDRRSPSPGDEGWWVDRLSYISSRRIAYPDWANFEAYIWDQGMVQPWTYGTSPTQGVYGLRISDYPGQFILHQAGVRGDYPMTDGLGRVIAFYMAQKIMAVRAMGDFVERFSKPWVWTTFNTKTEQNNNPRVAGKEDIKHAEAAASALGVGSLASACFSDAITLHLDGPAIKGSAGGTNPAEAIKVYDNQIAQAVSQGTLSTNGGEVGARGLGEVHERGALKGSIHDADTLAETLQLQLVNVLVRLNCPGEEHLTPRLAIHVEKVDAAALLKRVSEFAAIGGRPDAAWVAKQIGIQQVDPDQEGSRALVPVKPADYFALLGADNTSVPEALEALAGLTGVSLTPSARSALTSLPPHVTAQFVADMITKAASGQREASVEAGAAPGPAASNTVKPPATDKQPTPIDPPEAEPE